MELNRGENAVDHLFEPRSKLEILEHFANIINHALIASATFYITWYSFAVGFHEYQTVHAWFSTVGYQFFMSEGILAMYSRNIYTIPVRERWLRKRIHWILQVIGGSMALFGVPYQIYNRQITNRTHFKSTHGITGLISGIFLILTIASGCSALFSVKLRRFVRPLFSKSTHNFLSICCYTIGMISIISAYVTRSWLVKKDPGEVRFIMIWHLSFVLAFTLIGPLKTAFGQVKDLIAVLSSEK